MKKGGIKIKRYLLRLRIELFEKIKLEAKQEKISINKMIIKLLEMGLIFLLKNEFVIDERIINENKILYRERD